MKLIDKETGLEVSEEQAMACVHLIKLLGSPLSNPETLDMTVYVYLPKKIAKEMRDLIDDIKKDNEYDAN